MEQPRNPWSDGPEYVTQCPIQPGTNFTYTILFSEEEGTLWRHAHNDWNRATVIVHPRCGTTFPSLKPYKEIPIILGTYIHACLSLSSYSSIYALYHIMHAIFFDNS